MIIIGKRLIFAEKHENDILSEIGENRLYEKSIELDFDMTSIKV